MRYVIAKKLSDIKLSGGKLVADVVNDAFKSITVIDGDGNLVRITSPYSSVQLEIKEPPKTEKKYVLVVKGMPVVGDFEKAFDDRYNAARAESALVTIADETEIEERDVPVSDDIVSADIPV